MITWNRSRSCDTGACVEVALTGACQGGNCVEVGFTKGRVLVRDSKLGDDSPVVSYTSGEWDEVLSSVRAGFLPHWGDEAGSYRRMNGGVVWTVDGETELAFDEDEWDTFVAAVRAGEFALERLAEVAGG